MDPAAISPFTRSGGPASDLWYVTNGQAVVGPVGMELLLRGIHHGRVSDDCYIAQSFWQSWRPLDQVREIRALRLKGSIEDRVGRPETDAFQFAGIQDEDQLYKRALKVAVEQTHADVGLVHQDWPPHIGLVATHAYGRGMKTALARVIPWYDPAREAAVNGKVMLARSCEHDWARAATMRLGTGGPVQAVALVSVPSGKRHRTLIELGHFRHSFRYQDARALDRVVQAVTVRLEQLAF